MFLLLVFAILDKLGAANRREVAAIAARHALA
jgi:DNA-binding NarL/FixJ family response regulator